MGREAWEALNNGTIVHEGDIPSRYIEGGLKGSKMKQFRNNIDDVIGFAKVNPKKALKAWAPAGVAVGSAALAGKGLYDMTHKEASMKAEF